MGLSPAYVGYIAKIVADSHAARRDASNGTHFVSIGTQIKYQIFCPGGYLSFLIICLIIMKSGFSDPVSHTDSESEKIFRIGLPAVAQWSIMEFCNTPLPACCKFATGN